MNFEHDNNWFIPEKFFVGDTLFYWIKDSLIYQKDTLEFRLSYKITDSLMNYIPYDDTLSFVFVEDVKKRKRKKDEEEEKEEGEKKGSLGLSVDIKRGGTHDVYRKVKITSTQPISSVDHSKINLFMKEDTMEYSQQYTIIPDSLYLRKYFLDHSWEEAMDYRLFILPGAFTSIYGLSNDTIDIPFKIQTLDHYGKILLNVENVNQQIIFQLLNDKEQIIRIKKYNQTGTVEFPYLEPGEYKLKIIYDDNRNGKWDTGRYLEKIQPERVQYYSGKINVRKNWDLELNWDLLDK
jgi:hypothetical protein